MSGISGDGIAMMHWLHVAMGRGRRLAAYAADELPSMLRTRVEADLLRCPACRREVEAYRRVSKALRASKQAALAPDEAATFWPGVESRIRRGADAAAPSHRARPIL